MKIFAALLLVLGLASFNAFADININTATQEQLETLKGIGPAKARAIIDYRTKNGPFKSLADLEKVQGIGPGLYKNIKGDIKLSGETVVPKAHGKGEARSAEKKADAARKADAVKKAEVSKPATPAAPMAPTGKVDPKSATPPAPGTPAAKADAKTDSKTTDKGTKK
jgi:competence protein ComEA